MIGKSMRLAALCLFAFLAAPIPVHAQQLIESYVAFLSSADHYNSRGQRLTAVGQIIRQDRANFHRYGIRDRQDEWDSFFGSIENRAIAERMLLNGYIDRDTARYIINNEVAVRVEIYGSGTRGTHINVTAY